MVLPFGVPAEKLKNFLLIGHYFLFILALRVELGYLNWVSIDGLQYPVPKIEFTVNARDLFYFVAVLDRAKYDPGLVEVVSAGLQVNIAVYDGQFEDIVPMVLLVQRSDLLGCEFAVVAIDSLVDGESVQLLVGGRASCRLVDEDGAY